MNVEAQLPSSPSDNANIESATNRNSRSISLDSSNVSPLSNSIIKNENDRVCVDNAEPLKPPIRSNSDGSRNSHASPVLSKSLSMTFEIPPLTNNFDFEKSTEDNFSTDDLTFVGKYADIRSLLDYTYHKNYVPDRQALQDSIVDELLGMSTIHDINGKICTTPTRPWLIFTAGPMGAGKSFTIRSLMEAGVFPMLAFVGVDPDVVRK